MRAPFVIAWMVALGICGAARNSFAAEDAQPTPTPPAPATNAETPPKATNALGWRQTGLSGPAVRWRAGVSTLGAVSDRYAGGKQPGWLLQVAPRLLLERPPARLSGWLAWEPALQARGGLPARTESPFDLEQRGRHGARPSEPETTVHQQGSAGIAIGEGAGARASAQARRSVTLDQFRSEEDGLVEHIETAGDAALEWIAPDRGTIGLRAGATRARYPLNAIRTADFDRVNGSLDTTARFHLRMTGTLRVAASRTTYRYAFEDDGERREVKTLGANAFVEAQPLPALAVRAGAGPTVRQDPETTIDIPLTAGVTADLLRRYRASLDVGTGLEDSLWRSNRYVRVTHSRARVGAELPRQVDLGLFAGIAAADYPSSETTRSGATADRNDLTWGAGAEVSCQPRGRFRATLSVSHMERRSTFPGYEWEENRCVLSGFMDW